MEKNYQWISAENDCQIIISLIWTGGLTIYVERKWPIFFTKTVSPYNKNS